MIRQQPFLNFNIILLNLNVYFISKALKMTTLLKTKNFKTKCLEN